VSILTDKLRDSVFADFLCRIGNAMKTLQMVIKDIWEKVRNLIASQAS